MADDENYDPEAVEGEEEEGAEGGAAEGDTAGEEANDDAGGALKAAAPPKEVEQLPDEKHFPGVVTMTLLGPMGHRIQHVTAAAAARGAGGGAATPASVDAHMNPAEAMWALTRVARVSFAADTTSLPTWVRYLVADDMFYFQRVLEGKGSPSHPVAEEEGASANAAGEAATDEGGGDATAAAGSGAGADAGATAAGAIGFDPNLKFVVEPPAEGSAADEPFVLKIYVPPAEVVDNTEAPAGGEGDAAGGQAAEDGGGAVDDDAGAAAAAADGSGEASKSGQGAEEPPAAPPIILDALTLAALFSTDVLTYALRSSPQAVAGTVSLEGVCQWLIMASDDRINPSLEALLSVLSHDPKRKVVPSIEPLFAVAVSGAASDIDRRLSHNAFQLLQSFLRSNVAPNLPFDGRRLASVAGVRYYVDLLCAVPRTLLVSWMEPLPGTEESGGQELPPPVAPLLGKILLDIRKRRARDRTGSKQSVTNAEIIHARALPKVLESGPEDPVVTDTWLPRGYAPSPLRLYASDLVLTALSGRNDTLASYRSLLLRKCDDEATRRPFWAPVGTFQLLWNSLHDMLPAAAVLTVKWTPRAVMERRWLSLSSVVQAWTLGFYPPKPQSSQVASRAESSPQVGDLAGHAQSSTVITPPAVPTVNLAALHASFADIAEIVARRFSDLIVHHPHEMHIMDSVKEQLPMLAGKISVMQQLVKQAENVLQSATASSVTDVEKITTALSAIDGELGRDSELLLTPEMMHNAIQSGNTAGLLWLANRGVSRTVPRGSTRAPVSVLEYCCRQGNYELVSFLVSCGANLDTLWEGGNTTARLYLQEHLSAEGIAELLSVYNQKQRDRGVDPVYKHGILLYNIL